MAQFSNLFIEDLRRISAFKYPIPCESQFLTITSWLSVLFKRECFDSSKTLEIDKKDYLLRYYLKYLRIKVIYETYFIFLNILLSDH